MLVLLRLWTFTPPLICGCCGYRSNCIRTYFYTLINLFLIWQEHDGTHNLPAHHSTREPISKCGDLDITFEYKASSQKLVVTILEAKDIPDKDRSGVNTWQVHTVLMPSKKQRAKTSVQRGPTPVFKEKMTFSKVEPEELSNYALRFRLYAVHKMIREKMMGEQLFYLSNLNQEGEMKVTLVLEPRSNLSVSLFERRRGSQHSVTGSGRGCSRLG